MSHLDNCLAHAEYVAELISKGNLHRMYLQEAYNNLMFAIPPNYGLVPYEVCKSCGDNPFHIKEKLDKLIEIAKKHIEASEASNVKTEMKKPKNLIQQAQA